MPWSPDTLRVLLIRFVPRFNTPALAWSSNFFQPKRNFFDHRLTVLLSNVHSPFTQVMFLVTSAMLWSSLNSWRISSQIRLCCTTFMCVAFKSHTDCSNACISAPTNTILPTTVATYHNFNCFGHVIILLQTCACQNTAKYLTHSYLDLTFIPIISIRKCSFFFLLATNIVKLIWLIKRVVHCIFPFGIRIYIELQYLQ